MATIVDGKKRIPFMRGMLVHYLLERGIEHDEAYEVADAVRTDLRQKNRVSRKEVLGIIEAQLAERQIERPVGDLVFWERRPTSIQVITTKGGTRPFSKELLSHSIQASGLPPDQAYEVASDIERQLIDGRLEKVSNDAIEALVIDVLTDRHGKTYAERYRVWRAWGSLDKPLAILIGGASGVGKTSLAISLANILDIPRVAATDDIRQIMRLTLTEPFMPSIHMSSYAAWSTVSVMADGGLDPLIAGYREQARVVNVGVQAILTRCVHENTSVIIDGVHLLPEFLDLSELDDELFVVPLCLSVQDREAYEGRFAKRGKEAPARGSKRYLGHLEEILTIQEHILAVYGEDDIPVVDTNDVEDVTSAAVMVVGERLQEVPEIQELLDTNGKKRRKKSR